MESIMNEENDWDHDVEGDVVEGPVVRVSREEVILMLNEIKTENNHGTSDASLELITPSRKYEFQSWLEYVREPEMDGECHLDGL